MRPSPYESMSSRAKSIEGNPFGKMACGFGYRGGRGGFGTVGVGDRPLQVARHVGPRIHQVDLCQDADGARA